MTSRHASDGGRRGVATWIIVAIVAVVLVAAGTTAYLLIVGGNDKNTQSACNSQVVLPVVAAPGAASAITDAAAAFDATGPVARSACVSTTVASLPSSETIAGLTNGWRQAVGSPPGLWVADSEAALTSLESTNSALTAGRNTSPMASSPVVLAVRSDDAASIEAAGLSWQDLPGASGANGTVTLPSGQHLIIALPDPTTNRATSYALQSVVAGRAGGTVATAAVDTAAVGAAVADLAALASGATPAGSGAALPAITQPATTEAALTDLAAGTGGFTAVPVVESDLVAFAATTPGLTAVSPSGPTVGDAVYAVPLTAEWVTPTLDDATAEFLAFLRGPGGKQAFTDNGFVVAGAAAGGSTGSAAPSSGSSGADQSAPVPDAGPDIAAALAAAIGATASGALPTG